mgnify:CR=1 FL=1
MKCPRDGTELQTVEILDLELDKCHTCDGMWFDHRELDRIRDAQVEGVEEVIERKYGDPEVETGEVAGHMRCPRCGEDTRLIRRHYTYTKPVEVDYCPKCYGFWLDDGELDAIVGERTSLGQIRDPGPLKRFAQAMAKLLGRD